MILMILLDSFPQLTTHNIAYLDFLR